MVLLQEVPSPTAALPRRGSRTGRVVGRFLLARMGWRVDGRLPDLAKAVVVVAPHTSNWDLVVAAAGMLALDVRVSFLGKRSLFWWPLGSLLRWLGAIPVDRSAPHGVVGAMVAAFRECDRLLLGLAPEGTRRSVTRWHSGFSHIAREAGVPIIPVALDYGRRILDIGPPFRAGEDPEADLNRLRTFYSGVVGRRGA